MAKTRRARLEIFEAKNGEWCWRKRAAGRGRIVAVGGETFKGRHGAIRAARREFPTLGIPLVVR